jgi:hypothetical protein
MPFLGLLVFPCTAFHVVIGIYFSLIDIPDGDKNHPAVVRISFMERIKVRRLLLEIKGESKRKDTSHAGDE